MASTNHSATCVVIYFDHNATTPILSEVCEAMMPFLTSEWGNPSSSYRFGARLQQVIETSRTQLGELIGAHPSEVVFTCGGTESNNTAIHSAVLSQPGKRHIITSQVEHSSVLSFCNFLEKFHGYQITRLPVDREGMLSLDDLQNSLTDDTAIVSLMWANNETGVLFPVEQIAQLCRTRGVLSHCDAVQVAGKLPINTSHIPFDYLSLTGHKFGSPKGVGALYVRDGVPFVPYLHGGHQENERRGGTENVAAIVGFGVAANLALERLPLFDSLVRPLRDALELAILTGLPGSTFNGHPMQRLPNTCNVRLQGIDNDATLTFLDQAGICASSGSACMESAISPSHVITAMTDSHEHASESLRFSLSTSNTLAEVEILIQKFREFAELAI